ncbi:MAG: transcription-repair coupling factor [Acidimicrobiia bacterium]|nr:transcription-repair coupling factor [Acidimicrobiia bacterium]
MGGRRPRTARGTRHRQLCPATQRRDTQPDMSPPLEYLLDRWRAADLPSIPGRWAVAVGGRAFAIAGLARSQDDVLLVVVPGERQAEELADDLALFLPKVSHCPAWEVLPFEHVSPNVATMASRCRSRVALEDDEPGRVVVASVRAAIQRLSPSSPRPTILETGGQYDLEELTVGLAGMGYTRTDRVESRGEYAVRGGILDVFPADGDQPVRADFFGDELDDLRLFEAASQRSAQAIESCEVFPAREVRPGSDVRETAEGLIATEPWAASTWERLATGHVFSGMESWLPWLAPEKCLLDVNPGHLVLVDPARATSRSDELTKEEADLAEALAPTWGDRAPAAGEHPHLFLELASRTDGALEVPATPMSPGDSVLEIRRLDAVAGDPDSVADALGRLIEMGNTVVVAMDGDTAAERVRKVIADHGLVLGAGERSGIISTGIHRGFIAPGPAVAVLGEQEIAGRRRSHRRGRARSAIAGRRDYGDLTEGDYVVHYQHGIGRFEGLVSRTMAGVEREYLVVAYAAGDRLYVPTDQLAAVTRYTGGETPRVSRMGGKDWSDQKQRVRKAVAAVAQQVVELHRQRALATGFAFPDDSPWQRELEAGFPYEETPDQLTAISDVTTDLESARPMDRLIFGDVGFGKTEIAIRAAFKAVQAGKQVAVLAPTTLLAQQHHQTFSERLEQFPVRVEALSRFLTAAQQRRVVADIASGEVDVVVGTHRLLSDDVSFHDLGLLVIDEEQRFGVGAKDAMKRLRVGVDVLTLTATPIPRTLEMALTGIRDVSHIRTAPEDRHPILTYVGPYDEQAASAGIRRELLREGQVFYVHNRVRSIGRAVEHLRELVPDARYAVAHGQMSEGQLEQVMLDFWNHEYDVLVATTIIESGLDLPQVNTLIVERADLLGLAQLYQLRGRVGRSDQRAYAYLFHPRDERLTEEAHRRLEAVGEATDLGSGFHLALRDLEIRGAGSILGEVQSGHIAAVGFDLYSELVAEAVAELSGTETEEGPKEVRIDLPIDAHLSVEYVVEASLRLEGYQRLAATTSDAEIQDVQKEWEDRFGPLPSEAIALCDVARLRVAAQGAGLTEVIKLRGEVRLAPVDLTPIQEVRLERIERRAVLRAAEGVLFIPAPTPLIDGLIEFITQIWPPDEDK